jgi:hypothetical protein
MAAAGLSSFDPRPERAADEGKLVKGDFKLRITPTSLDLAGARPSEPLATTGRRRARFYRDPSLGLQLRPQLSQTKKYGQAQHADQRLHDPVLVCCLFSGRDQKAL